MSLERSFPLFALAVVAVLPLPVAASTCYALIDRTDTVVYQSQKPPMDLSDPGAAGAAARDAMRKRGEQLLVFESDRCVERVAVAAQSKSYATIDEIVMGFKSTVARAPSGVYGVAGDGGSGAASYGGGYADGRSVGDWGGGRWGAGYTGGYGGRERAATLPSVERGDGAVGRAAGRR